MKSINDRLTANKATLEDLGLAAEQLRADIWFHKYLDCPNPQTQLFDIISSEVIKIRHELPLYVSEAILNKDTFEDLEEALSPIRAALLNPADEDTIRLSKTEVQTTTRDFLLLLDVQEFLRSVQYQFSLSLHRSVAA